MEKPFQRSIVRMTSSQLHPNIALTGNRFLCNGYYVSLTRKPKASRIVQELMNKPGRSIRQMEVLDLFYRKEQTMDDTSVFSSVKKQTVSRIMSRLRQEFGEVFRPVMPQGTQWFHYDIKNKSWLLYKLPGEGVDGKLYA